MASSFAARAGAWLVVVVRARALFLLPSPARRVLRLLRRQGRRDAVQRSLAGHHRAPRQPTVISMANDYRGALTEFALVVPVPPVLERSQIHVGDRKTVRAHRCVQRAAARRVLRSRPVRAPRRRRRWRAASAPPRRSRSKKRRRAATRRSASTVEAQLHGRRVRHRDPVGEGVRRARDLAARERLPHPAGASAALKPVHPAEHEVLRRARSNLAEQAKTGLAYLRAAAVRVRVAKFMLPVRLGMLNAAVRRTSSSTCSPRRARRDDQLPHGAGCRPNVELPCYVREEFGSTYKAIFDEQAAREDTAPSSPSTSGT